MQAEVQGRLVPPAIYLARIAAATDANHVARVRTFPRLPAAVDDVCATCRPVVASAVSYGEDPSRSG